MNRIDLARSFAGTPVRLPADHPAVACGKIGVLIVNLGTPEATDYWSMRRYLSEFLSDPRVIEWPKWLWQPILQGIVLSRRPFEKGRAYDTIWDKALNESPLRIITRAQAEKLARRIGDLGPRLVVDWAMRYGNPSIAEKLDALAKAGCERIVVFPLYPQYAAATTATVNDKVFEALMKMRWQPAVRTVPAYHDDPVYIDALAHSIATHLEKLDFEPEVVITSFHGIPRSYFLKGDPYHCHCMKTARLLRERLRWDESRLRVTFQSRFGPERWLEPYTDETVAALPAQGIKRIAVVTPGFSADCLETIEEIGEEVRDVFLDHGGEKFAFIPSLNDGEEGMAVIESIVRRELAGWA